jgi:hypothetical protein
MPLLNKLDLSLNNFSGPIPSTISNCKKLGSLDLSWNNLSGEIPLQIEYIPDLYLLNLSHNHLSGHIPPQLQLVQTLSIIDFSYNNLSGQIPHFDSTNISAFVGNPFLCGDVLPSCNLQSSAPAPSLQHPKQHDTGLLSWLVGVLFSAAFIVLLVGMCCFFRKYHWYICRYFQRKPTVRPWKLTAFQRLDFSATEVLKQSMKNCSSHAVTKAISNESLNVNLMTIISYKKIVAKFFCTKYLLLAPFLLF